MNDLEQYGQCAWCGHPGAHTRTVEAGHTEAPCQGCPRCDELQPGRPT